MVPVGQPKGHPSMLTTILTIIGGVALILAFLALAVVVLGNAWLRVNFPGAQ